MFACEKFAKVTIPADLDSIRPEDRGVLDLLIQAAACLNPIYLRQVSTFNPQFKQEIEDSHSKRLIESFNIMAGPWNRFEDDKPFYGTIEKPLGAGFYPTDITREEFEQWCEAHPEDRASLSSFTTVVRRAAGRLVSVPYSQAYELELKKASALLRQAASIAKNESLVRFLNSRADALLSNDYTQSDADWIALDSDIEVVFGPYETYEDRLFGYKATYEAFVGYQIPEESARLKHISQLAEEMQAALPLTDEMKAAHKAQSGSPFAVIDLLSNAGEARVGVQTLAFVLPNDPEVIKLHGTKKVMMRNVQQAKFDAILRPIAARFLTPETLEKISFKAFFRHTILHETGHSLGVKAVKDSDMSIIHALSDAYAPIEECKADSTSTFLSYWLRSRGELTDSDIEETCATLLAGFFRSLRFGLAQAHARANAIQLNYYLKYGAVTMNGDGLFSVDSGKVPEAARALVAKIAEIQYAGDRGAANAFLAEYAVLTPELLARLNALDDLPIDIACHYEAEEPGFFNR